MIYFEPPRFIAGYCLEDYERDFAFLSWEVDGIGDFGEGGDTREGFDDAVLCHCEISLFCR